MERLFGEVSLIQVVVAAVFLATFVGLAFLFRFFLERVVRRAAEKTRTGLDDAIIAAVSKPVIAIIVLAGLYLAVQSLSMETPLWLFVSRVLRALLSLLGIYTAAALVYSLARCYECNVIAESETGLTRRLIIILRLVVILIGIFLGALVILSSLGIKTAPVTGWIGEHGWRLILIIVLSLVTILAVGGIIPKVMVATVARRPGELEDEVRKRTNTLTRVLTNAAQVVVILTTVFMALSELNINITPVLAGVGVAGIAIGFGAQSLVKDFVAGLFIILESQYRVGDVVRIADIAGLVEDINLRRTVLRDLDGTVHIVPNGEIRVASNFTKEWSRVNINVSVAYGEDLDRVMSVINRVGKEFAEDPAWAEAILTPPRALRVDKLGDSGIEIKILGETKPIRQWDVMGEMRKRLKKAFDEEGIEIPWPHTKVYFGNSPLERPQEPGGKSGG